MTGFLSYDSRDAACAALARQVAGQLRAGIAARGHATFAVCGGSSPVELLKQLARAELDWARVRVVATDERWVEATDAQSNEGMIRRLLLRGPAQAATLVSLYVNDRDPESALSIVRQRLDWIAGAFDAVVLGMGNDGHTASLFPEASNIAAMLEDHAECVVPRFDDARTPRISLGPNRLLNTRGLYLLFFGHEKLRIYEHALDNGPTRELPVRAVLHQQRVPLTTYWAK